MIFPDNEKIIEQHMSAVFIILLRDKKCWRVSGNAIRWDTLL